MQKCNEYEITVSQLLKVVHRWSELIKIYVISDDAMHEDNRREFYLTENLSENQEEIDRVLKYYADVPVWNIHATIENVYDIIRNGKSRNGNFAVAAIVVNCYYADVREGFLREKEDMRKTKRKEYNQRRKRND